MPCHTDPPTKAEREWNALKKLLREVGIRYKILDESWHPENAIAAMTPKLCEWCRTADVTQQSLELQIWWRDHQTMDERHAREKHEQKREEMLRKRGLKKLTKAERKALGV